MSRRVATEDDWDDDSGEEWGADDTEYVPSEGDDDPTMACPHCRATIFDESEQCPECGKYLSAEDGPPTRKPLWVVVTALICLAVALLWAL